MKHPIPMLAAMVMGAVLPLAAANPPLSPPAPPLNPPPLALTPAETVSTYGNAVAISGDVAAVAGTTNGVASVFLFVRSAKGWAEQAVLADPAGADPESGFGSVLALSGDTLAVSAGETGTLGAVDLYVQADDGSWPLQAHLQPPHAAGLGFGAALALAGDTLAVGAPGSSPGPAPGAVYVYARGGAAWHRQAILAAAAPAADDLFGRAVAVAHQMVVVGAVGYAEIFAPQGAAWLPQATLHGGSTASPAFGSAVTASNQTAAVGDPANQQVSIFIHTGAGWFHQQDLAVPGEAAGAAGTQFGGSVALSQESLVVGAPALSGYDQDAAGAVYVYARRNRAWRLRGAFQLTEPSSGGLFGSALAVSQPLALVGSISPDQQPQSAWLLTGLDIP
jgi:hypothetical protein